jgi:hypothetical protein
LRLEDFLAVPHGIEGRRPRAYRPDPQIAKAIHDAAYRREPFQVLCELRRVRSFGVQRRDGVGNSVLPQIVAGRHLPAEGIAPRRDGHLFRVVRRRLDQHWHPQVGKAQGVGNRALLAEVRQGHDYAVNALAVFLK